MGQKEKELSWTEEAALKTTSLERLDYLAKNGDYYVRLRVARNSSTSPETLARLAKDADFYIQRTVAINPHTPDDVLSQFVAKKKYLKEVAGNPNTSESTLEMIIHLQPDPDVHGLKKIFSANITQEDIDEVYKIVAKHPNLPAQYIEEPLQEGRLSEQDCHEAKANRNELPISLKVKDFLPYIHNTKIAILPFTKNADDRQITIAEFYLEDIRDKTKLNKSIDFYRQERKRRKLHALSPEIYSADDLLNATIVKVEASPITNISSVLKLTIREIEEVKEPDYYFFD